uniref:Putative acetyltransferase n=1 Tax=Aegilops tauschii TaxID=37682 RepID=M8AVB3_AEGTA
MGVTSISPPGDISTAPPPPKRWFIEGCPVPIPLPIAKAEDIPRRFEYPPPVHECSIHFSPESVKKLKAKANAEMAVGTATISSLQAVLAHLWRATCRARGHLPDQDTTCLLAIGCRTRLKGMPPVYVDQGRGRRDSGRRPAGLGGVASEPGRGRGRRGAREGEARGVECNPSFKCLAGRFPPEAVVVTGSQRFNAYGNDFGWGRPVAVRSGAGNKLDGMVTVYEGGGGTGSMELEVCLSPDVLARLVADEELMNPPV